MRAMFDKLPELIDPIYSAQHNKHFVASVNQARFPRLAQQLETTGEMIEVDIEFYFNKTYKLNGFKLKLRTVLSLECQRSLKPFKYQVSSEVEGVFVESMQLAEDLPSEIEVYELIEERISLIELVEDELLLNIPLSPINESAEIAYENPSESETVAKELEKKENPFAVLQGLKNNPN